MKHCPKCLENGALVTSWIAGNLCKDHWLAEYEETLAKELIAKG